MAHPRFTLSPSLLSADFARLAQDVLETEAAFQEALSAVPEPDRRGCSLSHHLDVMDGHFVPNLTFGPDVIRWLRPHTSVPFDAHLMVSRPEQWIDAFAQVPVQNITVHVESSHHLDRLLQQIRHLNGVQAGVSLNPATPLSAIESVLGQLDRVLVMSVNPGFGGQKWIPYTLEKVEALRALRAQRGLRFSIQCDGGIGLHNLASLAQAGVDDFVMGSAIYGNASHPTTHADRAQFFRNACTELLAAPTTAASSTSSAH